MWIQGYHRRMTIPALSNAQELIPDPAAYKDSTIRLQPLLYRGKGFFVLDNTKVQLLRTGLWKLNDLITGFFNNCLIPTRSLETSTSPELSSTESRQVVQLRT